MGIEKAKVWHRKNPAKPVVHMSIDVSKEDHELISRKAKESNMSNGKYVMLCVKAVEEALKDKNNGE